MEVEIAENDLSCGESSEKLCLFSLIDKEEDSNKGFVSEFSPEILIRGYTVLAAEGENKIAKRIESNNGPLNSTEHKFV